MEEYFYDSDVTNDNIDIYKEPQLKIKLLEPRNEKELRIELDGKCIDYSVINAIRRTILMSIPIYAFHRANTVIDLKKSKHMYNNDLIYNLIETFPIFDLPNYYDLENPEKYLPTDLMKKIFSKFIQEKYVEDIQLSEVPESTPDKRLHKVELLIDVKNNTDNYKFVSSHDVILRVDNKISNCYKIRKPISILVLKPGEEISLQSIANLGISKMHAAYEATTNAIHEELTSSKYILWYETLEQLHKNIIFEKACIILEKKLYYLGEFIKNEYKEDRPNTEKIEIQLYGEDHTLGNLLATILQKCEYVSKAGYTMPHPLIDNIIISYQLFQKSKKGPIKILLDCIEYLIKLFKNIRKIFLMLDN